MSGRDKYSTAPDLFSAPSKRAQDEVISREVAPLPKRQRYEEEEEKEARRAERQERKERKLARALRREAKAQEAGSLQRTTASHISDCAFLYEDKRGDFDFPLYGVLPSKEVPDYDHRRTLDSAANERWMQIKRQSGKKEVIHFRVGGLRPDEVMRYTEVPRRALQGEGRRVEALPPDPKESYDFIALVPEKERDDFHDH